MSNVFDEKSENKVVLETMKNCRRWFLFVNRKWEPLHSYLGHHLTLQTRHHAGVPGSKLHQHQMQVDL